MNPAKRRAIYETLRALNPNPTTELLYTTPFELLVAVVLSAQATDKGVNAATRVLFKVANTPRALLKLGEERLSSYIHSTGFYRAKARNVIRLSQALVDQHGGEVPRNREALEGTAGRRTKDSERGAEHGVRRGDDRCRYACVSRRQPYESGAGQ